MYQPNSNGCTAYRENSQKQVFDLAWDFSRAFQGRSKWLDKVSAKFVLFINEKLGLIYLL